MDESPTTPFPVIVGPTAGGKSTLAVRIAQRLANGKAPGFGPGEIVTADSMQVYRGMDIGTAKPTMAEREGIPHHLINLRDPHESFSVDDWLGLAEGTIADIRARGGTPIVVGGTLLYVKAFLEGMFDGPPADETLRMELEAMDPRERRAMLESVDPEAAARIHFNDKRRTIRAIEVHRLTGRPISSWQQQWETGSGRVGAEVIGLDWPTEHINRRINARVKAMVDDGLVDEVRDLWLDGRLGKQAREALGYKQFVELYDAEPKLAETGRRTAAVEAAIELVKVETRRFAKNQRTWLRRLKGSHEGLWIDVGATPADSADPLDRWAEMVTDHLCAASDRMTKG